MPKKKIFIADDQEDVLSLLKDFLTAHDFEVMILKEPKNILNSIISFKPDLILLDLLMPDLGGFEVCEILNKNLHTREIPIIIIVNTLIILRNRFIWYLHRSLQNREIKIALPVELDINTLIHSG